jgi:hypothetical protein
MGWRGFGFVHHSRSLFCRAVPNPTLTIRNFPVAVLQGASLKQREVLALRRTSRDLLTFPLFAAIMIAPLTPVGHVLIFSFIQKYFPALFPSQVRFGGSPSSPPHAI